MPGAAPPPPEERSRKQQKSLPYKPPHNPNAGAQWGDEVEAEVKAKIFQNLQAKLRKAKPAGKQPVSPGEQKKIDHKLAGEHAKKLGKFLQAGADSSYKTWNQLCVWLATKNSEERKARLKAVYALDLTITQHKTYQKNHLSPLNALVPARD